MFEKMQSEFSFVREGYIGIFLYVPVVFKEQF